MGNGKTLRGSIEQKPGAAASFIAQVSLYSQPLGVAIAQTTYATDESTWTLRAMEAPEWIKEIWPGSALIIAVRSVGRRERRPSEETRCYGTRLLTMATVLLQHVGEDAHRYREPHGTQVLSGLRSVALNLLRFNGFNSIADALGAVNHNEKLLLRLMCWHGQGGPQPSSA